MKYLKNFRNNNASEVIILIGIFISSYGFFANPRYTKVFGYNYAEMINFLLFSKAIGISVVVLGIILFFKKLHKS